MATMTPASERHAQRWAGSLLQIARLKSGLSQRELATRAGVPHAMIARIETGRQQPSFPTLAKLLAAAGFEVRTQLAPYDDHDDVLWHQDHARTEETRQAEAAMQARFGISD